MWLHDGGDEESDRPVVSLVRFGAVERDLVANLTRSLDGFFHMLGNTDIVQPSIRQFHRRIPPLLPVQNQGDFLLSDLDGISSSIIIGISHIPFYDPLLPRHVFGYGYRGRGVLSTFRFKKESENRILYHERLNKEVIKILALACDLPRCHDRNCIVVYHRTMEDIDRNTSVCKACREKFLKSLKSYLGGQEHE